MPPPSQGVIALEALGLMTQIGASLPSQVHAVRLALADGFATVRDDSDVTGLLDANYLARRSDDAARPVSMPTGGTVHLAAVDSDGMAISLMQSVFQDFGSGVVVDGVVLNNRAACFEINGGIVPGQRPYHTLAPAMLLVGGRLLGPVGVMGGLMQAQGQVQVISGLLDAAVDPQGALDHPRFRVDRDQVRLEPGLEAHIGELATAGLNVSQSAEWWEFGGGNVVLAQSGCLIGGADSRKDGHVAGY
jgi:gamma-glutamyltranspeptidase/glutathione hydrolase